MHGRSLVLLSVTYDAFLEVFRRGYPNDGDARCGDAARTAEGVCRLRPGSRRAVKVESCGGNASASNGADPWVGSRTRRFRAACGAGNPWGGAVLFVADLLRPRR